MAKAKPAPKRRTVVSKTINFNPEGFATGVTFGFPGGESQTVNLADLHPKTKAHAACHGIAQKVGDAAAMSKNPETGLSASDADKVNAAKEVLGRISDGSDYRWNAVREAGNGAGSYLFRALCRLYDGDHGKPARTADEVRAWMAKQTPEGLRALPVKNETIKALIAELMTEAAADVEEPDLDEGWDDDSDDGDE